MNSRNHSSNLVGFNRTLLLILAIAVTVYSCTQSQEKSDETRDEQRQEEGMGEYVSANWKAESGEEQNDPETAPKEWTDTEKLQLLNDFQTGKRKFDFYATFTEPFWTFYFFGNQVMYNSMELDVPIVTTLEYPFSDTEDEQVLRFFINGEYWAMEIKRGEGSDGMSDLSYPYEVKLLDSFVGGGAMKFVREQNIEE